MRAELKSLPKDLADIVGAHIWAAGHLIDEDPDLAFRHAEAARRRAGRLPIVREAAAETAYAAGEYAIALREFRAIRRMNGGDDLLPVIADCERALGRHRDALAVLAELDPATRNIELRIECLLVEAGIRDDLGQRAEALRLLKAAIGRKIGAPGAQARLRYAYADLLERQGDAQGAREWFTSAAALDQHADLDVADRLASIDGVVLPDFADDEDEDDDLDEDDSDEDLDEDDSDEDLDEDDSDEDLDEDDSDEDLDEDDSDEDLDEDDSDEDLDEDDSDEDLDEDDSDEDLDEDDSDEDLDEDDSDEDLDQDDPDEEDLEGEDEATPAAEDEAADDSLEPTDDEGDERE
ncbi:hypothetical protein [Tessaracoccus aquimaris]|uniref:hypothetical protein n=1 Tax=Tessaracoccus aquimaris TaxID=1332264 RepID=UPI0011AB6403|nr:hypothetical protein [Tessaracoccus aquimaris]